MSKHTPGPWTMFVPPGAGNHFEIGAGCTRLLACIYDTEDSNVDDQEANARLIAAAPDLLEAAEEMELVVRDHEIQGELSTLERAAAESLRAAIARAKGEE